MTEVFKLAITGFGCLTEAHLVLEPGMTLVHGPSGIGKSTILRAIKFCLYGERSSSLQNCSVKIETNGYIITRRKSPSLSLVLKFDGSEYKSEEAQAIIDQTFGTEKMFFAGCCAVQKHFNPFFKMTSQERYSLVESILQEVMNFANMLKEVKTRQKDLGSKLSDVQMKLDQKMLEKPDFVDILVEEENKMASELTVQTLDYIISDVSWKQVHELGLKCIELKEERGKSLALQHETISIKEEINRLSLTEEQKTIEYLTESIANLEKSRKKEMYMKKKEEYDELASKIPVEDQARDKHSLNREIEQYRFIFNNLDKFKKMYDMIIRLDQLKVQDTEKYYNAQELGCFIEYYNIKQRVEEAGGFISDEDYKKQSKRARDFEIYTKINPKRYKFDDTELEELTGMKYRIDTLKKIIKTHSNIPEPDEELEKLKASGNIETARCPNCEEPLLILGGTRLATEKQLSFDSSIYYKVRSAKEELEYLTTVYDPEKHKCLNALLKSGLTEFDPSECETLDLKTLDNRYEVSKYLRSLAFIPPQDYDIEEIKKSLKIKQEISKLKDDLDKYMKTHKISRYDIFEQDGPDNIEPNMNRLMKLRTDLDDLETLRLYVLDNYIEESKTFHRLEPLVKAMEKYQFLKERLDKIPHFRYADEIDKEYDHTKDLIRQAKTYRSNLITCKNYLLWKDVHDALKQEESKIEEDLKTVVCLYNGIMEGRAEYLNQVTSIINDELDNVAQRLFDDPITIELQTFKGDDPAIDLHIDYNGRTMVNISSLSGGEADRVSTALTVALNKVLKQGGYILGKFLFLDEVGASLDPDNHRKLTEVLQSEGPEYTLMIEHEVSEADFNTVMQMKEIIVEQT